MTITRRTFTAGIGALLISHAVSGCTDPVTDSGNSAALSTGSSGVWEPVTMGQLDFTRMDLGHISPGPTGIEAIVATATVDPSRHQCLFLREEGNAPTTTGPGSGDHDPASSRPAVTSVPTMGNTTVKGAVLLCAGGAFALRRDSSDCYPATTRLSTLGYHRFIVNYRVRPHTRAEASCDLARATRFVRARAADYSLPSAQHIALGGYSAGGILCGETILNWSGSTPPTELDVDYTPDALDAVSADAAATAMIYSFHGRLSVTELNPNHLTGVVPTYYCYGTKDPFYDQFKAQAKVLAGPGATLQARMLDGWPYGFGAGGGRIEEYDVFLQQAFASA